MTQLEYIRKSYGVEAHKGQRIRFLDDKNGIILGGRMGRLRVRFEGGKRTFLIHPTWSVEYLQESKGAE